ncbi:hypothetical protein CYMTET_35477 [Cymbomonas tetramitiformis]|uniref:2,4-dienoyl-CoA reductase [(3E)-enoyl-CoA-producing] n=1 Tax=Cymbomonas tetramitiformis TaxID=36881 RepID=A0AAE0KP36_9CHLO|nr:hypothetical protein CYMTET_35477 [Cymbomonas tetramitiformis]
MNITATLHLHATWWQIHACAAKAGVDAITRNLALEWGEYGIRVNGIAPGAIAKTAGMTKISTNEKTFDDLIASAIPLAKAGERWDIAMSAVFLASSGGRYITGDTIVVDGGHMLWKPAIVPRSVVSKASRAVENKSRKVTGISKL